MKYLLFMFAFLLLISCGSDDETTLSQEEETIEEVGFFNLRVGNSWAYEYFRRESNTDVFNTMDIIEEQEIIAVETVNGEEIFTVQVNVSGVEEGSPNFPAEEAETFQIKDSLGYLVRLNEGIIFSNESTQEYLRNNEVFLGIFGVLLDTQESVTVPAGDFECTINEVYAVLNEEGDLSPGRDEYLYADGIGEVLYRISFVQSEQHTFEQRLIDFNFPE